MIEWIIAQKRIPICCQAKKRWGFNTSGFDGSKLTLFTRNRVQWSFYSIYRSYYLFDLD